MKSISLSMLILCLALGTFFVGHAAAQTGASFAAINFPGAIATGARGVNIHGEIVGWFQTSTSCTPQEDGIPFCFGPGGTFEFASHGFRLLNGKFTRFDVTGASATAILGVNDLGDFVGVYVKTGRIHGFLHLHTGVFKTLDIAPPPLAPDGVVTAPMGINDFGTVVGSLWSVFGGGPSGGFRWSGGHFTKVNFPGFTDDGIFDISDTGVMLMQLFDHDFWTTALLRGSDADVLASPAITDTHARGINSGSDIVGFFGPTGFFAPHVESNEGSTDTEITPRYLSLMFPGAVATEPNAIGDNRAIVGSYTDGKTWHGFLAVLH